MKAKLYITLTVAAMLLTPLHTQARQIKVYTFNGPSRKQQPAKQPCLDSLPLGCVSFKTSQTWKIESGDKSITQEWSDVVMATGCKKDNYDGGATDVAGPFKADCLQNPGYGDLYSWIMVATYKSELCPDGWRVPTKEEFVALDIALAGVGSYHTSVVVRDKYLALWGGSYGGCYDISSGGRSSQGGGAHYWALSEPVNYSGFSLAFTLSNTVYPDAGYLKSFGFMLRCVK